MSRAVRSFVWAAALGALPLAVALLFLPGRRALALDLYLLLIGSAAVFALVRALGEAAPAPGSRAAAACAPAEPAPARAGALEREVVLSASSAFDLHYAPAARAARDRRAPAGDAPRASTSTADRRRRARAALGEELWELVRPGPRAAATTASGPGSPLAEPARASIAALERI